MTRLIYQGRADADPVFVGARVVTRHPDNTITFSITDRTFLDRIGYGPSAYVERQAYPIPQVRKADTYYWAEPIQVEVL
jgi:hypothetical protein